MDKDFLLSAFMAAEGEINLIVNELTTELDDKINESFQEPDERWVERILAFTFKEEIQLNYEPKNRITKDHFIAARKAKTLMYLQGLNIKTKMKQMVEIKSRRCLGHLVAETMNSSDYEAYFKLMTRDR
ncbi:MAG: hypothetical protein R6U16_12050 [Desulfotignum sp.]